MSLDISARDASSARAPARPGSAALPIALAVLAGLVTAAAITAARALLVWRTGIFVDPDDAMRVVEVRDLMAGQGWFDLVQHRLSPDHPFPMHWSRIADVPLVILVKSFTVAGLSSERAERLMLLVAPAVYLALSLYATVRASDRLIGPVARLPAALLLATTVEFLGNFMPGHIHHHGLQATLLLGATALLIDAVGAKSNSRFANEGPYREQPPKAACRRTHGNRARFDTPAVRAAQHEGTRSFPPGSKMWPAFWSAVLLVVSLGIGLQNIPFAAALAAALAAIWLRCGAEARPALGGFGAGLAAAAGPVFLIDVPPGSYSAGVCDAYSAAHLLGCGLGGLGLWVLSRLTPTLPSPGRRMLALCAVGLLVAVPLAICFPACLGDPMAGVDPLLRSAWLDDVGEALPLLRLIRMAPSMGIPLALTLLGGLACTGAAFFANPSAPNGWGVLLMLGLAGCAGTLWQVRVAASTSAAFVPGITWLVIASFRQTARRPERPALLFAVVVGLLGNGSAWAAAGSALRAWKSDGPGSSIDARLCFAPSAYGELAALPPGLVLSTIDPGSTILAYTPHTVLAAPYHRNSYGNRVALTALVVPPEASRPIIQEAKARYIALCRDSNETSETLARHPDSLSAALLSGHAPPWLTPVGSQGGPFLIFRVDDPAP